jgi:hypothetical protein
MSHDSLCAFLPRSILVNPRNDQREPCPLLPRAVHNGTEHKTRADLADIGGVDAELEVEDRQQGVKDHLDLDERETPSDAGMGTVDEGQKRAPDSGHGSSRFGNTVKPPVRAIM